MELARHRANIIPTSSMPAIPRAIPPSSFPANSKKIATFSEHPLLNGCSLQNCCLGSWKFNGQQLNGIEPLNPGLEEEKSSGPWTPQQLSCNNEIY